jgi:hypothetical protein
MARKIANYTVTDEGRDKGKLFVITEMSAARAESWAMRVLLALIGANVELPEGFEELGMAGLAELGMRALSGLKWEVAEPLLGEMMECIQIIPDPKKTHVVRALSEEQEDIAEVMTRLKLRMEVFKLHTDFLEAVAPSLAGKKAATAAPGRTIKTSRG